ncbi:MAG: FAD-dependent oxidoreductase, partial [Pseudonocardia sp.]
MPSAASRCAVAAPMPRAAPVTIATRASGMVSSPSSWVRRLRTYPTANPDTPAAVSLRPCRGNSPGVGTMSRIVVCGAGVVGLSAAMMLARYGHQVTVLEADPDGAPARPVEAWTGWKRRGVAQFHQPHALFSRFRQVCEQELPGMVERLLAVGCVRQNRAAGLPPGIVDRSPPPGGEPFELGTPAPSGGGGGVLG